VSFFFNSKSFSCTSSLH